MVAFASLKCVAVRPDVPLRNRNHTNEHLGNTNEYIAPRDCSVLVDAVDVTFAVQ